MRIYDNLVRSVDWLSRSGSFAINLLLPPRCPITGEVVDRPGMVSGRAWASLRFVAQPSCDCCGLPFDVVEESVLGGQDALCAVCIAEPKIFAKARASLVYDDASKPLILSFKHSDQTQLTVTFGPWLYSAASPFIAETDMIIPVPLHWVRLLRRRYNQSAILAQSLARLSQKPCYPDALIRQRNTPTQGHLNAKQRHENVKSAFAVRPKYTQMIAGKNILLVDDVYTTGATIEECAKVLLNAGAQRVDVVTLARVVRPDSVS